MTAKLIYYPIPENQPQLTREDIAQEFSRIGKHDRLAQALRQILAERLAGATMDAVAREPNAPGRLEEIVSLQGEFATLLDEGAALRKNGARTKLRPK